MWGAEGGGRRAGCNITESGTQTSWSYNLIRHIKPPDQKDMHSVQCSAIVILKFLIILPSRL